jgi:threonine dehydratase
MASGAMDIYDWFHGAHAPNVFYYESASKYLQFELDLQIGGLLVYPSALDNEMRTIRRNSGAVMYSRNAALLPPLDFSMY